jgi:hypothetical protein
VSEGESVWQAGVWTARWVMNFRVLRLKRAETLRFRLDHKEGNSAWEPGPTSSIDVVSLTMSEEDRQKLLEDLRARGLPAEGGGGR